MKIWFKLVEWQTVRGDSFENNLLLQPDVVFNSESNGRNLGPLEPPCGEKKLFSLFYKMMSRVGVGVFRKFLAQMKASKLKKQIEELFIAFIWAKNIWKNAHLLVTSFCKKSENNFFLPPGGARELKLRSFDSESKTASIVVTNCFRKKPPLTVTFYSTSLTCLFRCKLRIEIRFFE